jgi:galactonate dehydratase
MDVNRRRPDGAGYIRVSEKPGIGVEINEEGMRKYATPGVPFFA